MTSLAVVHNGVIENYQGIKEKLLALGYSFRSATDSEVIAHLIAHHLQSVSDDRWRTASRPSRPVAGGRQVRVGRAAGDLRPGRPLSRPSGRDDRRPAGQSAGGRRRRRRALRGQRRLALGRLHRQDRLPGRPPDRRDPGRRAARIPPRPGADPASRAGLGPGQQCGHAGRAISALHAQGDLRAARVDARHDARPAELRRRHGHVRRLNLTPQQLRRVNRILLTACGTSWHAALVGEYLIEELARLPVEVEYASELRYRNPPLDPDTLLFAITQSGETADTLAALREMKRKGHPTLAICNVVGSTIAQEADGGIYLHAGPEIGVASTKAYTSQWPC